MANDPISELATGLAEDHKAEKRKRATKPKAEAAGDQAAEYAEDAGSTPEEAEALGEVVEDAVADADDSEDRPSIVAERVENIAAEAAIATETLEGDLTATLVDLFKTRPKPWGAMTTDDQRQVVAVLKHASQHLVKTAVQLIADKGDGAFMAKLEKYADGGGLKIALTAESTTDNVLACHAAQGQFVMVSRYDPKPFSGTRREPEVDPAEPEMAFDSDKDDPGDAPEGDSDLADPFGEDADPDEASETDDVDADTDPDQGE